MSMKNYIRQNNELNMPVDGQIQISKDKLAAKTFYKEHVYTHSRSYADFKERLHFLIDEGYIDPSVTVDKYSEDFIIELEEKIKNLKVRFNTFMGPYKLHDQYLLKEKKEDGSPLYLERYEDRVLFNALYMGNGNEELATKLAMEIANQRYQPATPTWANAGKLNRGEMVSCFLIDVADDMNSIGRSINSALQLSRIGGGVGINLSNLREAGAPIKNVPGAASGVVPVMKLFEDSFKYSNQLGQRQGAGVTYLSVFHMDILDFLSTKNENASEEYRMKTLSIAITVPDIYYELVESNSTIYLISSYDASREYGIPFSKINITEEYENIVNNPNIRKKGIPAKTLNNLIGTVQQESGYPYIMNIDTVNRANPINGKIIMSNLCSEILQVQDVSVLNDNQDYEILGKDISCNLGSINIPNFMKKENGSNAESAVDTMVRALTFISDDSNIDTVPSIRKGNAESHAIGLGAMGLHELFASNQMMYGEPDTIEFTDKFFEMINYLTIKASNAIARERSETFVGFELSEYANGEYFNTYLNGDDNDFKFEKNRMLFEGFPLPSKVDWLNLKEEVMKYGLYNQNRMAVAPNGSISYVNETTASLHPIVNLIEKRSDKKLGYVFYPAPNLNNDTIGYYRSAYDTSMLDVIDVYAAAQKHIDQGMSLTLFLKSKDIPAGMYPWKPEGGPMSTKDLTLIRHYAWRKGIKTLYYVRSYNTDEDSESGINECESCMV